MRWCERFIPVGPYLKVRDFDVVGLQLDLVKRAVVCSQVPQGNVVGAACDPDELWPFPLFGVPPIRTVAVDGTTSSNRAEHATAQCDKPTSILGG
jgi:hypothetical protein